MNELKQARLKRKFATMFKASKVGELINNVIAHTIEKVKTKEAVVDPKKLN